MEAKRQDNGNIQDRAPLGAAEDEELTESEPAEETQHLLPARQIEYMPPMPLASRQSNDAEAAPEPVKVRDDFDRASMGFGSWDQDAVNYSKIPTTPPKSRHTAGLARTVVTREVLLVVAIVTAVFLISATLGSRVLHSVWNTRTVPHAKHLR